MTNLAAALATSDGRPPGGRGRSPGRSRRRRPRATGPCCRGDAADRQQRHPGRQHGAPGLERRRPRVSAGNSFRASAPARRAANASLGVATPGRQAMPAALAAVITRGSVCGMTTSRPPASCSSATSPGSITVPAPTSTSGRRSVGEHADAGERLGRVERHLEDAEPGLDQGRPDRLRLVRPDATKDRDQRQLGHGAGEGLMHRTCSAIRPAALATARRPCAAASAVARPCLDVHGAQDLGVERRQGAAAQDRHGRGRRSLPRPPGPRRRSAGR